MLDNIKALGYKFSTRGALTVSVADIIVPACKKPMILSEAEKQVHADRAASSGAACLSENERYTSVIQIWEKTTNDVTNAGYASRWTSSTPST